MLRRCATDGCYNAVADSQHICTACSYKLAASEASISLHAAAGLRTLSVYLACWADFNEWLDQHETEYPRE